MSDISSKSTDADAVGEDANSTAIPGAPKQIGKYKIMRRLGGGSFGDVFLGRHEVLGSEVAIKILKKKYSENQKIVTRFFNEARAVNIVSHPSLVKVFDSGFLDNGEAFIIMEYVNGETLAQYLDRQNFSIKQFLELCNQIANALAIVHQNKIIHRDLKPDNIMITPDDVVASGRRVKILDFGIAKMADSVRSEYGQSSGTAEGEALGTPAYMAPEQLIEGASAVDQKADVFSLGVIMYRSISGKRPYDFQKIDGLVSIYRDQNNKPDQIDSTTGITQNIMDLIIRMLSRKPHERPTMKEVSDVINSDLILPESARKQQSNIGQKPSGALKIRLPAMISSLFALGFLVYHFLKPSPAKDSKVDMSVKNQSDATLVWPIQDMASDQHARPAIILGPRKTCLFDANKTKQIILVNSSRWDTSEAGMIRFQRTDVGKDFNRIDKTPIPVQVGEKGMAWRSDDGAPPPSVLGPRKWEGDGRSPAGCFQIGELWGLDKQPPKDVKIKYHIITDRTVCVSDEKFPEYGQIRELPLGKPIIWNSYDKLNRGAGYKYALQLLFNANRRGTGSCIFFQVRKDIGQTTVGNTAIPEVDFVEILRWIEPKSNPIVIQLPAEAWNSAKSTWNLPDALRPLQK